MEVEEYARIAAAEDDHWWYRSTRALMAELLAPWLAQHQRILDAGCGPGGNGAWLAAHGHVVGIDIAPEALQFVRSRRPELAPARASMTALPFPTATFDVVVEVTVAYTLDDDRAGIAELARVVRPGGVVLLIEPAFSTLRRAHDTTVHSVRRYRRADLVARVEDTGLHVERASYAYSFLAPPALVLATADRVRGATATETGSDVEKRWLDRVFAPLAHGERAWLRRRAVPFGTSAFVVATRPD